MTLYELILENVKDVSGKLKDPGDYENAALEALKRYSKHRPRLVPADIPGQDGPDIALPEGWVDGLSLITSLEYPIGNVPESVLDRAEYRFYLTPSGTFIRFDNIRPPATEAVRILYNILHDETSLPSADLEPVANLAASFCCRKLAALYANTTDPTIQADSVNYRSKSSEYTSLANKLETLFKDALGIKPDDTTPAALAVAAPPAKNRRPWRR